VSRRTKGTGQRGTLGVFCARPVLPAVGCGNMGTEEAGKTRGNPMS